VLGVINGVLLHDMFEGPGSQTQFVDLGQAIRGMLIGVGA
jgi:hypothetical protein